MYLSIVVALALGILALAFVLYPLLHRRPTEAVVTDAPPADDTKQLAESELSARTALQEVELDFQLGNIAEPDYQALRERYMRRALVSLRSRYEHEQSIDDEIEEQLRKMKEQKKDA